MYLNHLNDSARDDKSSAIFIGILTLSSCSRLWSLLLLVLVNNFVDGSYSCVKIRF